MEIWHPQVQVQVVATGNDPLARIKLELWQRSCTSNTKYFNGVYSPKNSFTIRLVSYQKNSCIYFDPWCYKLWKRDTKI